MHDPSWAVPPSGRLVAEILNPAHYDFSWLALPHFVAAMVIATIAVLVVAWERNSQISRWFAGFSLLFVLWLTARGLLRCLVTPELVPTFGRFIYTCIVLALPMLYEFAEILLRRRENRRTLVRLNWLVGGLLGVTSAMTPQVIAGAQLYSWGYEPLFGPLGYVLFGWVATLMLVAGFDFAHALRAAPAGSSERRRVLWFGLAIHSLYFSVVDFLPASGIAVYPLAFLPVLFFTVITAMVTWRFGLVEVTAALAGGELVAMLRSALLIVDRDAVVRVVNDEAVTLFGQPREALLGRPAGELIGDLGQTTNLARQAAMGGRDREKELVYTSQGAEREIALSASAVKDKHGRDVAYVCIVRDVTEQKASQRRQQAGDLRDPLTTLPGRPVFVGLLEAAVRRARESRDHSYAVLFLGLDRLRFINEDLGHAAGDQVLTEVAGRLWELLRPQDALARVGGDEFAILLAGDAEDAFVRDFVARVEQVLKPPVAYEEHEIFIAASIGIATHGLDYTSGGALLRDANVAMHRVKERGGGGSQFATAGEGGGGRPRLEAELRHALESDQLVVHYQPIVDLQQRSVAGFEALVRWRHPRRGLLQAFEFIEFAEAAGLLPAIDRRVLGLACADLARLRQRSGLNLGCSVNLGQHMLADPLLPVLMGELLERHALPPGALFVELLESAMLDTPVRETLKQLRALGIGLSIDDFGTGYSSFSRLHDQPITALKIDHDFIRALTATPDSVKLVGGIVALAGGLKIDAIAEGVSTPNEAAILRDCGCRYAQGFFFSAAVSLDEAGIIVSDRTWVSRRLAEVDRLDGRASAAVG